MNIGFIGLGNVGAKLAGSLIRNNITTYIFDLDKTQGEHLCAQGAIWADNVAMMTANIDMLITCLPSPEASAKTLEGEHGVLATMKHGLIWAEMSTTDYDEVTRLGTKIEAQGGHAVDCPVSGGCHRAATGNISILAGCSRATFDAILPILTILGRRVLHAGPLGAASKLKVLTNYLATINLISVSEALTTACYDGFDMNVVYEAIKISSGTSFVHETESQVILNGSRDINFTMDLVLKDVGLFQQWAENIGVDLEISPLVIKIFADAVNQYGGRELSPNIIKRYEEKLGIKVLGKNFPDDIIDDEPEEQGYEVKPAYST